MKELFANAIIAVVVLIVLAAMCYKSYKIYTSGDIYDLAGIALGLVLGFAFLWAIERKG